MTLTEAHQEIADHCAEIAKLFKQGARVTVIVRNPGRGVEHDRSADLLVGDDDPAEVLATLEYLRTREERRL